MPDAVKLYIVKHDNGEINIVATTECANMYRDGGSRVYAIDAVPHVPEPQKEESPTPLDLKETAPEPRTVKAYVAYDPGRDAPQGLWVYASADLVRGLRPPYPVFEIEMREVPPAPKRETGWVVKGPSGLAFGTYGSRGNAPCFFSESTAKELASSSYYSEGAAHAVEVYRDTLEPVDAE